MSKSKKKSPQENPDDVHLGTLADGIKAANELLNTPGALTPRERDELRSMIAAAGIATATKRAAEAIRKADALGDDGSAQVLKISKVKTAHKKALNQGRGAIDPQKMAEMGQHLQEMLDRDNADRKQRAKELKQADLDVKAAALEQAAQADWRQQGCPVTTSVAVGKPLKLKPRRP